MGWLPLCGLIPIFNSFVYLVKQGTLGLRSKDVALVFQTCLLGVTWESYLPPPNFSFIMDEKVLCKFQFTLHIGQHYIDINSYY